ncbi:MAG: hypothetical protein H3C48_06975 [Chitinophagaceae bacterium]|nr:hypothetical protein [Chitinophagaceae bacterium]
MTLILTGLSFVAKSQGDYKNAIGVRLATPDSYYNIFSFSYKDFVSNAGAIEINAGGGSKRSGGDDDRYHPFSLSVSGTYQHHFDMAVSGLRWFVGGGAVMYNSFSGKNNYRGFGFGIYPTGGIDYKFNLIPLNLTADYRPTVFFAHPGNQDTFHPYDFGISARYVIGGK